MEAREVGPTQAKTPPMARWKRDRLGHGSAIHLSFFASALRPIDRCCAEPRLALSNHPRRWAAWVAVGRGMVGAFTFRTEAISRGARMLRTALGPAIAAWLEDPGVVEVMLNPDGRLWVDRLTEGLIDTGERLTAVDGERVVRLVAHHVGAEVHSAAPRVSAELPESGERFEGLLPPIVAAPTFAIRKPAVAVFTLDDYVAAGIMSSDEAGVLRRAVEKRRNVLVRGGASARKTPPVNALLAEVAKTTDRVVLIEDTRELQCKSPNLVALRTKDGVASLSDLVRSSLRLRPDRIPIGEVRGAEALDLL